MKKPHLILFFFLLGVGAQAQPSPSDQSITLVRGFVTENEKGTILSDASIAVKDEANRVLSFIPRAGEAFTISLLRTREHFIQIHLQGYHDTTLVIHKNGPMVIDLGKLALLKNAEQLQSVVVKPPITVHLPGKTIFRASEDPDAKSFMAFDLFRKVPGITIDGRDQIRLNGHTNFRIFINGRPSNIFTRRPADILKQFPASLIKDIEVISPPPARYDAEGVGGIINLVMLRSKVRGTIGSISLSFHSPFQAGQNLSLTGKYGKWGIQGMLSQSMGQNPVMPTSTIMEDLVNKINILQTGTGGSNSLSRMGNFELSFEANPYNLFTLAVDANRGQNESDYQQQVDLSDLLYASSYSEYRTQGSNLWNGTDYSFDYQHTSPVNPNRTFTLSLRQSQSADLTGDRYEENKKDGSESFTSLSNSNNHYLERTGQIDYFTAKKKHSFEIGGKFIHRENFNLAFYGFSEQNSIVDDLQQIGSGYTSLSLKVSTFKIRMGIRAEASQVQVLFRSDSTSVLHRYLNVLPNIGIQATIRKYGSLFMNYSQRVQRPGIHYLNPFVEYIDPYNVSFGNPQLLPSLFHSFQLGYSHSFKQSSFNASMNYQFSGNSIVSVNEWGQDTVKRATFANLGEYNYAGISINGFIRLSEVVSLSLGGYVNYYRYSNGPQKNGSYYEGLSETVTSGLSFRFKKSWSAGTNFNYNGTQIQYQGKNKGYTFHSLTINKNFIRPRINFSLSIQNPFLKDRKNEYFLETVSLLQHSSQKIIMRRFSISFTWNFGKLNSSVAKAGRTISNDDLMK